MNRAKTIFCLFLFVLSFLYAKDLPNDNFIDFILKDNKTIPIIERISNKRINNPVSFLDLSNKTIIKENNSKEQKVEKEESPIIYIFNTHQTEEYAKSAYNITPTVVTVSNILKEELSELGIPSIVETKDVIKEVNKRGYDYSGTYTVSFENLKLRKKQNSSLKYYFDMHRDSVTGSASRTTINNKKYATIMFLIGANHEDYQKNLNNVKIMEKYLKKNYPGLVRETYIQKNWTYNQWYSSRMFLVELGGPDNTLEEIYNTTIALAHSIKYYMEVDK
ncbi:MAG: stage II sporulation protein P [Bacilli bacterium]|nr:stage II sporulation protein P [Bacilli bacterium]